MEMKFYRCKKCGQIVGIVKGTGSKLVCCGEEMVEIVAGEVEASKEKHIPVVEIAEGKVKVNVGSIAHPMQDEHFIEWIAIQTKKGNQRKALHPGDEPKCCFRICDCDEVIAVYAYCNLHGLWKVSF